MENKCVHKNRKEIRTPNKRMLWGYDSNEKCLDCGTEIWHVRCQIKKIIEFIAQDMKKSADKVTPQDLCDSVYFNPTPNKEQAQHLINNAEKYI